MRDVAHAGRLRSGRAVGQRDVALHHLVAGGVVELLVLLQVGLHDPQPHVADELRRRARQPPCAIAGEPAQQHGAREKRQPGPARVGAVVGEQRGCREHRDRDEREAPDSDQRGGLRQHQRTGQRVAVGVPGKSGEQVPAQPFGDGERDRKRQHTHRPARPDRAREGQAESGEQCEAGGNARSPRTAASSRTSWRRPGRRGRSSRARQRNSRSRTTIRPRTRSAIRRAVRPPRRRPARPAPGR